jgi:hypothetical protein
MLQLTLNTKMKRAQSFSVQKGSVYRNLRRYSQIIFRLSKIGLDELMLPCNFVFNSGPRVGSFLAILAGSQRIGEGAPITERASASFSVQATG